MQNNKLDKHIVEQFKNREMVPSNSAWERLSSQLNEYDKKKVKKKRFVYLGYAASILILISVVLISRREEVKDNFPNNIILTSSDTIQKNIKLKEDVLEAVAKVNTKEIESESELVIETKKNKRNQLDKLILLEDEDNKSIVAVSEINKKEIKEHISVLKTSLIKKEESSKKRIRVNAEDLLYAVTHSSEEVKIYYAKYNINRSNMLDTIEKQLRKSNLKINPEVILAEVENTIEEADFQQNFMKKFKTKLSDVLVAIADRNN